MLMQSEPGFTTRKQVVLPEIGRRKHSNPVIFCRIGIVELHCDPFTIFCPFFLAKKRAITYIL